MEDKGMWVLDESKQFLDYQALLRVARAAKALRDEAWDSAMPCDEHWPWEDDLKEALKGVEHLLDSHDDT